MTFLLHVEGSTANPRSATVDIALFDQDQGRLLSKSRLGVEGPRRDRGSDSLGVERQERQVHGYNVILCYTLWFYHVRHGTHLSCRTGPIHTCMTAHAMVSAKCSKSSVIHAARCWLLWFFHLRLPAALDQ